MKATDLFTQAYINGLPEGGIEWFETVINDPSFKYILKFYYIESYVLSYSDLCFNHYYGTHSIFLKLKPGKLVPSLIGVYVDEALKSTDPELKGTYVVDNDTLVIFQPWKE